MNQQLVITFVILLAAILLFLSDRVRPDLVALLVAISLGVTTILTPQETFSGFSRSAVFTLMGIFIMAEGLRCTGVTEQIGNLMLRLAGQRERPLILVVMLVGALLSLFMNNIAAASVLLPAVFGAAQKSKISSSRLLMPLAFSTLLGGMATLFTSTNIVVSSLLRDYGLPGFRIYDFLPLGIPIILVGTIYMVWIGKKWLPAQSPIQRLQAIQPSGEELAEIYRLDERLAMARVIDASPLIGVPLYRSRLREQYNLNLIAIQKTGHTLLLPTPDLIFDPQDLLLIAGRPEDFEQPELQSIIQIQPSPPKREQITEARDVALFEAILSPRSTLIGQTLKAALFREKYMMNVIAIWRAGRPIRTRLTDLPLQFGDSLLMQGPRDRLRVLQANPDLIVLTGKDTDETWRPSKAWLALSIMLVTLVLAALSGVMIGEVMLAGAIAMVLLGILNMDQAYQAIEWRSIFLVAGMLPLGIAMSKTGAAALLAQNISDLLGPAGPYALLGGLFFLVVLFTQVMNGAVVAAILAPIGIAIALKNGFDPRPMAMLVALGTSMAFMTPLGHPVNILVMGPAGYRFRHYMKVGAPLTILLFLVIMLLLPVFWPIYPK
jgi:di/tricarboxylate transporter